MKIIQKLTGTADKVIYWSIIAVPFVASFSSAAVNILIAFMIVAFLFKRILTRDARIERTQLNFIFLLLIAVSLISFINTVSFKASLQGIFKLLKYGFLLLIISQEVKDKTHLKRIACAILLGLLLASLDAVYQLVFGVDFFRHKPYDSIIGLARLKAAFPHTNIFAGYLALFLPVSLPLYFYYLKGKKKMILGVIALLGSFSLVFTFCRSAGLGVWLAILLMGLIKKDKFIIAMIILSLIIAPFIMPNAIKNWAKTTNSIWELLLNKERFVLYETSLNMIKSHPVVGVGVNTFVLNYQKYKLHDMAAGNSDTMWYAHNSFLQLAGEIGVFGLGVFLLFLYLIFSKGIGLYHRTKDNFLRFLGLGVIMGILAFLVNGLTETNLYYPKIATLFWFEIGLLMGILRLNSLNKGIEN